MQLTSTMKTASLLRHSLAALTLLVPALAFGQGQLTPPGPAFTYPNERALTPGGMPTPSMKTLMQIDAGEHIPSRDTSNVNLNGSLGYYLLASPGRYYLTENLDKNIVIASDNVTLDLGGFEVRYTGGGTGPVAIPTYIDHDIDGEGYQQWVYAVQWWLDRMLDSPMTIACASSRTGVASTWSTMASAGPSPPRACAASRSARGS